MFTQLVTAIRRFRHATDQALELDTPAAEAERKAAEKALWALLGNRPAPVLDGVAYVPHVTGIVSMLDVEVLEVPAPVPAPQPDRPASDDAPPIHNIMIANHQELEDARNKPVVVTPRIVFEDRPQSMHERRVAAMREWAARDAAEEEEARRRSMELASRPSQSNPRPQRREDPE
jgi:hypothetical protein